MRLAKRAPWWWLVFSTAGVVLAFVVAALVAWHRSAAIDEMAEAIATDVDPAIRHLAAARTELHQMGALAASRLVDAAHGATIDHDAFEESRRRLHGDLHAYLELPSSPAGRSRWQTIESDVAEAESGLDAVVTKLDAGDVAGAIALRDGELGQTLERADTALGAQIAFEADRSARLGEEIESARRSAEQTSYALHALAVAVTLVLLGASVGASRRYVSALRAAGEAEAVMTRKLESVAGAAVSIAESVRRNQLRDVLRSIVETSRAVVRADVAALVVEQESTLRSPEATRDPRFGAFPADPPAASPFLDTPVRHEHDQVGHLYLARAPGAPPFGEQDERAVELLATIAATAIRNAKLYAELRQEVARREDLVSIVSHDLRNPLSAVALAARTLRRALGAEAPGRRQVDTIARNVARMDRLIADLLAVAKLQEGGTLPIEPLAQDAGAVVREVVDGFAGAAFDKGVDLRFTLAPDLPPAYCDSGRIAQVLSNLVGNALKFTPRGGSVVVTVMSGGADALHFSVRDSGVGIPEDALPHVFERFWQNEHHRARGTGLGLYIAKGIIDAHHGRIWVTSRVGEGSDFQFTVPAASWPDEVDDPHPHHAPA
jgi:signal transduction histidine kinase